jgi:tetratricopeptide (TPR) repeat protein
VEARKALERASALVPSDPVPVALLARLALDEGLPREACRLAARSRALAPDHPRTLEALATCALGQHDLATAVSRLEEAVQRAPNDEALRYRLDAVRAERHRAEEAFSASG